MTPPAAIARSWRRNSSAAGCGNRSWSLQADHVGRLATEHSGELAVAEDEAAVEVFGVDHGLGGVQQAFQQPPGPGERRLRRLPGRHLARQFLGLLAQHQMRHHLPGEGGQLLALQRGQAAGDDVQNAERAENEPVAGDQWRAGVEPQPGRAGDEPVAGEAAVHAGVGHFQDAGMVQGMRAERLGAGEVPTREAYPDDGLGELAVGVHEVDQGDGGAADLTGQRGQVVQHRFGVGVERAVALQHRPAAAARHACRRRSSPRPFRGGSLHRC